MFILGLSCYYHDSAAVLIKDGVIVGAAQEERFTRKKHDERFPVNAVSYVLQEAGITIDEIDFIAYNEKPFLKFERLLETFLSEAPRGFKFFMSAVPVWLKEKLFLKKLLVDELNKVKGEREKGKKDESYQVIKLSSYKVENGKLGVIASEGNERGNPSDELSKINDEKMLDEVNNNTKNLRFNLQNGTNARIEGSNLSGSNLHSNTWIASSSSTSSDSLQGRSRSSLRDILIDKLRFVEHHQSHAASAFYPSGFNEAAILTLDGVGEWTTTSLAYGKGSEIKFLKEINFPHSLGLFYSAFTYFLGFKVNSGEYKVMGLAPYGEPKYVDLIKENLIDIKEDGSFKLNMDYFAFTTDLKMVNSRFEKLFDRKVRTSETMLDQKSMDIAASLQVVTEEIVLKLARYARQITGSKNLCMAGGVALNCVANGKILKEGIFENIWIQPASGDAGGALGAALAVYYEGLKSEKELLITNYGFNPYLGPSFSNDEVKKYLDSIGAIYEFLDDDKLFIITADLLSQGKVVGWHKGRMEFGPRALGNRSILGDPRNAEMQKTMNLKIKYRESFRPFAPSVLAEKVSEYFDINCESPYMLFIADVAQDKRIAMTEDQKKLFGIDKLNVSRSVIPAVTHVDYSARIQTVSKEMNPKYHSLISAFYEKTGCPILVNTSFNVRGEPIVCTPEDSYLCFMRTEMDILVIENFIFYKEKQPKFEDKEKWQEKFELD